MQKRLDFWLVFGIVPLLILTRFLPHPDNFSPFAAAFLFSGAYLGKKWYAYILPLAALFFTDMYLGLYPSIGFTYLAYILTVIIGQKVSNKRSISMVGLGALMASITFFIVSNLGVWAIDGMYTRDFSGLVQCFTMALPFFKNTLLGNIIYSGVLFSLYELAKSNLPALQRA